MNQVLYKLTQEKQNEEISYGIAVYQKIQQICHITNNKEELTNLITLCNRNQLSPIHLKDVVEDFFF